VETNALVGQLTPAHRRWSRTVADRPVVIFARTRGRRERRTARLRDYCRQGIGLVADQPLAVGDPVILRLLNADGGHVPLVLRVRHCTPDGDGQYQVGAELLHVGMTRETKPQPDPKPTSLAGKTVCNFDRVLDVRVEGDRVWLNMHPPGATSGWGMFVLRRQLDSALGR
jgi:hypothetical protein